MKNFWNGKIYFCFFIFLRGKGASLGTGTLGGGEGFLKGLLLGEWVGGTVHL